MAPEGSPVNLRISLRAALALVALTLPVGAGTADGAPRAHPYFTPRESSILVRVPAPGVYAVSVTITSTARRHSMVALRIGPRTRRVGTDGKGGRSALRIRVAVHTHLLAIRAADRQAGLHLSVSVRRLHALVTTTSPLTSLETVAVGPTGPTGPPSSPGAAASVSAGATGASAPPPPPPPPPAPAAPAVGPPGPPGDPSSWHSIFDDEFNGSSLDRSTWSTGWFGSGITPPVNPEELQCYDPAQVVQGNGELDINLIAKSESCGGQTRPYASGLLSTRGSFTYTYGYVEARVWLPGTSSLSDWPAIWTDGQNWPADGELDVLEGLGGQACWHFHDPLGAPGGCAFGYLGGWHTFGADWERGSVTYYYDGINVGTITSGITSSPMYVILNLAADNAYGGPLQAPATMRVDYVRIWQH